MQIETYEIEEITGELGVMAADAESLELIEKLGLTGQKKLSNPATATRQPYRQLTQLETSVFSVLFPEHTKLSEFASEPIPLRVLQVAAQANEIGLFKHLEVWHPENPREKDPVLIGVGPGDWTWDTKNYLLARWGDSLLPLEQLAEKAKKKWLAVSEAKLQSVKRQVENDLIQLQAFASATFDGGVELKAFSYSV